MVLWIIIIASIIKLTFDYIRDLPKYVRAPGPKTIILIGRGPMYTPGTDAYNKRFQPKI